MIQIEVKQEDSDILPVPVTWNDWCLHNATFYDEKEFYNEYIDNDGVIQNDDPRYEEMETCVRCGGWLDIDGVWRY